MTAARKLPAPQKGWPPRPRYERGEITVRPHEPAMQLECKRCGALLSQQYHLYERQTVDSALSGVRHVWTTLPCVKCPLELRP